MKSVLEGTASHMNYHILLNMIAYIFWLYLFHTWFY